MDRPIYRTLADLIERRILAQAYPVGSQIPPEPELEREFAVSRTTVRQALALLKRRGMLVSRSGLGTVVKSDGAGRTSLSVSGSVRDLVYYAAGTQYRALDRVLVPPPAAVAAALRLSPAERVVRFRGLRARGREPFAFEEVCIPQTLGRDLDNRTLGTETLFGRLEQVNDFRIAEVKQTIAAVAAPAGVARLLGRRAGMPMLKTTRIYRLASGRAVEHAVTFYDSSRFEYDMKLLPE